MTVTETTQTEALAVRARYIALLRDTVTRLRRPADRAELDRLLAGKPLRLHVAEEWPGAPLRRAVSGGTLVDIAADGSITEVAR